MMSGKDSNRSRGWSRRALLKSAMLVSGVAVVTVAQAQTEQKLAKQLVQYQETPKEGHECDGCVNFVAPASCKIVDGAINPKGWCVAFAPKEG